MSAAERVTSLVDRIEKRRRLRSQYRAVFSTEDGKSVLEHLARECGMFDDRIGSNEKETWLYLGERRMFLRILSFLRMTDEQLNALVLKDE